MAQRECVDDWGEHWNFTTLGSRKLFGDVFGRTDIEGTSYGNILTTIAPLHGLAASEIDAGDFDQNDPNFELLVMVRAVKACSTTPPDWLFNRQKTL